MKNKVLVSVIFMAVAVLTGGFVFAQGNSGGAAQQAQPQIKMQTETQTANQGDATQIMNQTEQQVQEGVSAGQGVIEQAQQQIQQKLQETTDAVEDAQRQIQGNPRQNPENGNNIGADGKIERQEQLQQQERNQVGENDGTEVPPQVREQEKTQTGADSGNGQSISQQRRSQVAAAVQEMLQIADRDENLGQQIRTAAREQNQEQEKLETALQEVEKRSVFLKFLIGPNYGEINNAQKILEQNRQRVEQLSQIQTQLANEDDRQRLEQQIQILEQSNLTAEDSLKEAQKGFSLFGWLAGIFAK